MRTKALVWGGAVLSAIAGLVLAASAQAVEPGANGRVFYEGGGEIFSVDPDGSNPTNLTNTPSVNEQRPSVSGDGQRVAFMEYSNGWSIWRMNGNGSSPVQITTDGPDVTNFEPGISPDGSNVVFMKQTPTAQDLWMVGINGGAQTDLTNTPVPAVPGTNLHSDECCGEYSPDGTKIVYANGFNSDVAEAESNDIWVMNSNGTNQHGLTGPHDYPIQDIGPSWSPDGTKIAFARTSTGDGSDGLYVMDSDGTNLTPIMNGAEPRDRLRHDMVARRHHDRVRHGQWHRRRAGNRRKPCAPRPRRGQRLPELGHGGGRHHSTQHDDHVRSSPLHQGHLADLRLRLLGGGVDLQVPPRRRRNVYGLRIAQDLFRPRRGGAHLPRESDRLLEQHRPDAGHPLVHGRHHGSEHGDHVRALGDDQGAQRELRIQLLGGGQPLPVPLDGAGFAACTSPKSYSGLANGSHTFRARAIDKAGNVDSTPAARTFNVQP